MPSYFENKQYLEKKLESFTHMILQDSRSKLSMRCYSKNVCLWAILYEYHPKTEKKNSSSFHLTNWPLVWPFLLLWWLVQQQGQWWKWNLQRWAWRRLRWRVSSWTVKRWRLLVVLLLLQQTHQRWLGWKLHWDGRVA